MSNCKNVRLIQRYDDGRLNWGSTRLPDLLSGDVRLHAIRTARLVDLATPSMLLGMVARGWRDQARSIGEMSRNGRPAVKHI
jgi:hypothetical protein